jgi:general secretion pathway protein G
MKLKNFISRQLIILKRPIYKCLKTTLKLKSVPKEIMNNKIKRKKRLVSQGFSFIEILIVMAIIAMMMALVAPKMLGRLEESKKTTAGIQMKSFANALDLYRLDNSTYPTTEQGLEALMKLPEIGLIPNNWKGPYLKGTAIPKDPWKNDYMYQSSGSAINMKCLGADKEEGGEGLNSDILHE